MQIIEIRGGGRFEASEVSGFGDPYINAAGRFVPGGSSQEPLELTIPISSIVYIERREDA